MKTPKRNGQWTLNETAERQADQDLYRQLTEAAAKTGEKTKAKPALLPTAVVNR